MTRSHGGLNFYSRPFRRWLGLILLAATALTVSGCQGGDTEVAPPSPTVAPTGVEDATPESDPPTAAASPTSGASSEALGPPRPTPTANVAAAPVEGALAPDLTLTDLNGEEVRLSALRGQAVLLNFWATW